MSPHRTGLQRRQRAATRRLRLAWRRARAAVTDVSVTRARLARALDTRPDALDDRVREVRLRMGQRLPAGPAELPAVRASLVAHAPRELESLLTHAARAADRTFDLLGSGPCVLGRPIDWQADFKSGHRWPARTHHAAIPPTGPPGSDIKVPWELSRGQHLPWLAQATLLSGDERYAREAVAQIDEWIEANPVEYGPNWVCAMDVALRAVNWIWTAGLLSRYAAVDDAFYERLLRSLLAHGRFIEVNLEDPPDGIRTNHYLADLLGLLYLGTCCPELAPAPRWRLMARQGLAAEIQSQVLDDGVSYESSIPYHRLVTEIFLSAAALEARNGRPFEKPFLTRLAAMVDFVRAYTKPDGRAPQLGDADDGRVHVLSSPGASLQDHRHLLAAAAVLFDRDDWWQAAGPRWTEGLWFGAAADPSRWQPPAEAPAVPSCSFPHAGVHILRHAQDMVLLSAGRVGTAGLGNHKHNDLLAIEVHLGGEDVLVDPGTYLYTADPAARNAFRSTMAHGTVAIDGVEQNEVPAGSLFSLRPTALPRLIRWAPRSDGGTVVVEHDGYERLPMPVTHRRSVTLDAGPRVLVEDAFLAPSAGGLHEFVWTFPFAPGCRLAPPTADGFDVCLPSGRWLRLSWPEDASGRVVDVEPRSEMSCVSPSYGVLVPAPRLRWRLQATAPLALRFSLAHMKVRIDTAGTSPRAQRGGGWGSAAN